jgi:2-polyprenyl-3-methyl-5-hydroxy-6-metoxy-1,4-benzoquinol methylase
MNIKDLLKKTIKPELYEPGDAVMWTDEHISRKLLEVHLNPDIDLATRKPLSVEKTLEFILSFCNRPNMDILDLGCGPGIYCEKLALKGHQITGIDFSRNSIAYAKDQAKRKNLDIKYLCQSYLDITFDNCFDLIFIIYTDLGVLIPKDRIRLHKKIRKALKPGGTFIFDVINDRNLDEKFKEYNNWKVENGGFWMEKPYLELSNGIHYPEKKVFLNQHTIIDENNQNKTYRFWTHYFNDNDLIPLLNANGFENIQSFDNVLPEGGTWNGDNISFYKINKPEK